MSDRRRDRIRLDISREAAQLFWSQGVGATSGEQIAAAMGLSVRTLWRYFRNKESCAEPIITEGVEWFMTMMRRWPLASALEDHFASELVRRSRESDSRQAADDLLSVRMIKLAETEPSVRSAWLMACDQVEREMAAIFAIRLHSTASDPEVRKHAAAAAAVLRVINEDISRALVAGTVDHVEVDDVAQLLARAVRVATGGAVGDPAES